VLGRGWSSLGRKKLQTPLKVDEQTVPGPAASEAVEKETESSFVVVKSVVEDLDICKNYGGDKSEDVSESSTESLKQLSDQISGLLNQTNQTKDEAVISNDDKNRVVELEQRNIELAGLLEQEKLAKRRLLVDVEGHVLQIEALKGAHAAEKEEIEDKLATNVEQLNEKIVSQSKTISLLVGEKVDLETKTEQIEKQLDQVMKDKAGLELSTEQLGSACLELRNESEYLRINQVNMQAEKSKHEKEMEEMRESSDEREEAIRELQTKLNRVTAENDKAQKELGALKSEHEMSKVHLTQLRGAGAQNLLNEKEQEISALNNELSLARKGMAETAASRDHLAADREQLAQQYSSYSRDLASQAEKLSEQLRRYQGENARLVQRELALVDHVATLETQLQTFIQGGKNVTEEEVNSLKEKCLGLETDLRLAMDERTVLQQMFDEKSGEVDVLQQRISGKDTKILELETAVERLGQAGGGDNADKESLLKACESDKVAASNAMRQNMLLKEQVIELQQALVKLTNDKADLADQLDTASRRNHFVSESQVARQAELQTLGAVVKEREVTIANLRNQVRYLEHQSESNQPSESIEAISTADEVSKNSELEKELIQAKEEIRSLNSHASELRSQLEVLSSGTREESRCQSTHSNSSDNSSSIMADSTMSSLSTESFVEIGNNTQKTSNSSASFVQLEEDHKDGDTLEVGEEAGESDESRGESEERRVSVEHFMEMGGREAWQQLEKRFQHAMEMVAQLSTDKEQLEHLVTQLQDETEIVGDYITIYQHQRKQQRLRMEEKDTQLRQLGKDREDLTSKLDQLQTLVKQMVGREEVKEEVVVEEESVDGGVVKEEERAEKILVLLSEIGTDSNQILDKCEKFEPWLWNGATGKVITV